MSFGSGVGDFIAVRTLLYQIGATLRDSTGASSDYQDLVLRFDCFEQMLEMVQISSFHLPPSTTKAIFEHVLCCKPLLEKFNTATEKYKMRLEKCGSARKTKDTWRKIGWGVYKRDEILELFDGLGKQMDAINLLLSCYPAQTVNGALVDRVELLKRIESTVPADLSPWTPDYKPIRFVDALDHRNLLPYELCRDWKVFQNMLRNHFDGLPGSYWVNNGLYEIINEDQAIPLTINNWNDNIMPGMELSMSILLTRRYTPSNAASCPSCDALYKGYGKPSNWEKVRCLNCRAWFQISEKQILDGSGDGSIQKESSATSPTELYVDELKLIRRFKVLNQEQQNERSVRSLGCENHGLSPDGRGSPPPVGGNPQRRAELSTVTLLGGLQIEGNTLAGYSRHDSIIYSIADELTDTARDLRSSGPVLSTIDPAASFMVPVFTRREEGTVQENQYWNDPASDDSDDDDSLSTGSARSTGSSISFRSQGTSHTALSIHVQSNATLVNEAVGVIAETLARSKIRPYVQQAVEYIHDDLFMDKHVRLLRDYALDLKQEATTEIDKQACEIIRSRYKIIGRAILSHFQPQTRPHVSQQNIEAHAAKILCGNEKIELLLNKEGLPTQPRNEENDEDDNNENECEVIGSRLIEETKQFLISSRAFEKLFNAVRERVELKMEAHLLTSDDTVYLQDDGDSGKGSVDGPKFVEDTFRGQLRTESASGLRSDVDTDPGCGKSDCEPQTGILNNCVISAKPDERPRPPDQSKVSDDISTSILPQNGDFDGETGDKGVLQSCLNHVQIWIENAFRIHIAWWPLPAPRRECISKAGMQQIWWKCKCGQRFIKWVHPTTTPAGQNQARPSGSNNSALYTPQPANTATSSLGLTLTGTGQVAGISGSNTQLGGPGCPAGAQPILHPATDYVLLIAESPFKSRQALGWIVLPPPGARLDGDFFRHLNKEYRRLRRWDHAIFTFRVLCYFKFVKFHHFSNGPKRIVCLPRQEIPSHDNKDYDTTAAHSNPPIPPPPIDPVLMNHFYKYPECADDSSENVELIPKRVNGPLPNTERIGWGLEAVEGPNGLMIMCVTLLMMGIAGWFASWWIGHHPGDLQSATIVFTLFFSVLTMLVTVPRYMWARVWDKEYGGLCY